MLHIQHVVEWQHLAASTTRVEQTRSPDLPPSCRQGPGGLAPLPGRALKQLNLPIWHARVDLRVSSAELARRSCPVHHGLSW